MRRIKSILAIILVALLVLFMLMNTQSVAVHFIGVKLEAPAAIVVLFSSVTGVVLWPLLRALFSKSKPK